MHMHGFSNKRNNIFLWTQKHGGIFSNDNFELISSDRMFKSNWFNKNEINYLTSQKSPEIGLHSGKAWSRLGDKIAGARFLLSCIPAALCTWSHSHMPHTAVRWRCDFQWHVSRYIAKGKDSVPEASANISPSFIDFDGNTPLRPEEAMALTTQDSIPYSFWTSDYGMERGVYSTGTTSGAPKKIWSY